MRCVPDSIGVEIADKNRAILSEQAAIDLYSTHDSLDVRAVLTAL